MKFTVQHVISNRLEKQFEISAPCVQEHRGLDKKSPVFNHLLECEHFNYVENLHSLPPSNNSVEYLKHVKIAVYDNTKIIDISQN